MSAAPSAAPIGLLLSGGVDSCILLAHLLESGRRVRPFYVRSQLAWQREEMLAVERFLQATASPHLEDLVILDLPLRDLYGDHWSVTGCGVPDAVSADDAVYLPGRNVLLIVKAAIWCRLHGLDELALAVLRSNPFSDATPEFFDGFESALDCATGGRVRIVRPFARLDKRQVMDLGRGQPLELTFSCIAPVAGDHCGQCNKCAERQAAFRRIGAEDPTRYASNEVTAARS
ncbi:MAG TPA: 7-cyano-7-deazaguanine synthase [Thermoguttaceae bacterium]|nr:7-cyano-7-deazaguanine synthase [Thermoguttaceae bacterium]